MEKYGLALDKAIFEATQHQEEKERYIKTIQDLVSKSTQATQKLKEKEEKEALASYTAGLERRIERYGFVSERIKSRGEGERRSEKIGEKRREKQRG